MDGYFPRALAGLLKRAASRFPAVVLTGPRQSGKTVLLRELFDATHDYVSLDDPTLRRFAREDGRGFLEDHPPPLILDEIQYAPDLLVYVKMAIDGKRDAYGRYLITGSQSFPLMQGVSESLAGRAAVLRLLPLSTGENPARRIAGIANREDYARWILCGTYPEIHRRPDLDPGTWYASYIQTYLERDVRTLANVGNLDDFERLMALLASRTGAVLNYSVLGRELGVAPNTVKTWISILEASGVVFLCPAYYASLGKRLIKSPKAHLIDPGLVCRLTLVSTEEQVLRGPMAGALFESFVAGELLKLSTFAGQQSRIYHLRTVAHEEVDFVVENGGKVHALECKLTSSPTPLQVEAALRFLDAVPKSRRGKALLACTSPHAVRLGGARVLPLQRLARMKSLDDLF